MRLLSIALLWLALLVGAAEAQNATKIVILGSGGNAATVTAGGLLNVNAAITPSGTQNVNVTQWGTVATSLGQKAMTASVPMVIASDQSTLPVNLQAAATGAASYTHIVAGQATTTVKSGAGTLYAIIFNSKATATNVTTIYDNTAGSGTVIGIPDAVNVASDSSVNYGPVGVAFATGLTIVTATANGSDMTVVWK